MPRALVGSALPERLSLESSLAAYLHGLCQTALSRPPNPLALSRPPNPNHWLQGSDLGAWIPVHCRRPDHPDGIWVSKTGEDWGEHSRTKTLPVYRTRLIIPGITRVNMGSSFRYPQRTQPPFTWYMLFPARHLCTKICQGDADGEGGGCLSGHMEPRPLGGGNAGTLTQLLQGTPAGGEA